MALPPELASLPPPQLVDELSYSAIKTDFIAKLKSEFDAVGIDYDVEMLQTDPGVVLMQVAAYVDLNLRQRINEAIRSWFLAYATDGDLDVLAQWYDVQRLLDEDDEALRRRIIVAIQGRSTGGTEARYRSIALGADARVADAAIYTVGRDPTVRVAVFATDNSGVADAALLAKVDAALQAPDVRMVNDTIVVASAAQQTINIAANVWLLPSAPESVLAAMEANLRASWARDMLLGRDLTKSWVLAQLQVDGVQKVELTSPVADVEVPFNHAAALGTISLTKSGRAY